MDKTEQQLCLSRDQPFQLLNRQLEELASADPGLYNRFCSWQDVVYAIEEAKGEDNAKGERSFFGKHLRAPLRRSAPVIATLDSMTNMIPDQNGLSILRGGLVTVFKLVHLRLQTRNVILEVFEDIPDRFVKAVEAERRFPNAVDLRNAVAHLCDTLVANLGVLIPILLRSHPQKNILARLWKQHPGKESEVVQTCLAEISRASKRVKRCSTAATERTIGEMHTLLLTMSDSDASLRGDLRLLTAEVSSGKTLVQSVLEARGAQEGHEQKYLGYHTTQSPAALPLTAVTAVLAPPLLTVAPFMPTNQTTYPPLPAVTPPPPSPRDILAELLDALDVPDDAAADMVTNVTQRGLDPGLDAGTLSDQLLTTQRFHDWLVAPASVSDLIIVDGHCGNFVVDRLSPLSEIAASLVDVVLDHPVPAIVLHHFCGQCVGAGTLSGPRGLIRNLVHQLLVQGYQPNEHTHPSYQALDFIDEELISGVQEHDIPSLCRLFCELIVRLDASRPVFCIIDGVSEIETVLDGWQGDTCMIIDTLMDLVDDEDRAGAALRVLLCSPERSTGLVDGVIPTSRRLSLLGARGLPSQTSFSLFQRDVAGLLMEDDMGGIPSSEMQGAGVEDDSYLAS